MECSLQSEFFLCFCGRYHTTDNKNWKRTVLRLFLLNDPQLDRVFVVAGISYRYILARIEYYITLLHYFSSATPYTEELENNIELLIHDQDLRQHDFSGEQNRTED